VEIDERKKVNSFCYQQGDKIVFIDLYYEKTSEYRLQEFKEFIVDNQIDETAMILSNRTNGIVTPLYKYLCTSFLKKNKVAKLSELSKEDLVVICYEICKFVIKKD
jgi:hypothetical protein